MPEVAVAPPDTPPAPPLRPANDGSKSMVEFKKFMQIAESLGPAFQGLSQPQLVTLHRDFLRTRAGWGLHKDVLTKMSEIPSDDPTKKPLFSPVSNPRAWIYKRRPLSKLKPRSFRIKDLLGPPATSASADELGEIKMTAHADIAEPVVVRMDRSNPAVHSGACVLNGQRVFLRVRKAGGVLLLNILDALTMAESNLEVNSLDVRYTALGFSWETWLNEHLGYSGSAKPQQSEYYLKDAPVTRLQQQGGA